MLVGGCGLGRSLRYLNESDSDTAFIDSILDWGLNGDRGNDIGVRGGRLCIGGVLTGLSVETEANVARKAVIITAAPIARMFFFENFMIMFLSV